MVRRRARFLMLAVSLGLIVTGVVKRLSAAEEGPEWVCRPVGCQGGTQPCADVSVGPVTYHCYERIGDV